ncbi:MAG: methylase [Bacteroidales bacterium]|nr:methylase [Bacteroidales bacterium]
MSDQQRRATAREFVKQWSNRGYEKGDSQPFWLALLRDICGVEAPETLIRFEEQVKLDHTSFIDGYMDATKVMIEQKSAGKDLRKGIRQSDGTFLTPFQQAKRYSSELPYSQRPRWIVTSNFEEIHVHDMERPQGDPEVILVADLEKEYYRLDFLVNQGNESLRKEKEVSLKAGELVGRLYDLLLAQYRDPSSPETLKSLNKLCVRLVFCLYAEDAGMFPRRDQFVEYLLTFNPQNVRRALIDLFRTLDTRPEDRDPYDSPLLLEVPYVNGGLFTDEHIEIPTFTPEIITMLEQECSLNFDWSGISPTIFGGVFESTLNPATRREGGMHYTSIENIHKVIDPLFLNDLTGRLDEILQNPQIKERDRQLRAYQDHLASLRFLDPACGSGNFLTETYLSLRRLENRALKALKGDQGAMLNFGEEFSPIKVSIYQFYGIEINDFAATVAKTALWISEAQMQRETEDIIQADLNYLPLKSYDNIVEGNALTIDWATVVPRDQLSYIIGNPPFVGARMMGEEQKKDVISIFGAKWRNVGNIDYVGCWFKKAADFIKGTDIRCAFVATNSITQGEQVPALWKPLIEQYGLHIDFAHRTFRWDSESNLKAHVHCVIVGFSEAENPRPKYIFDGEKKVEAKNINPYLIDAPDLLIDSRQRPICEVPEIGIGNKPIDGGNYLFSKEEMEEFIQKEPKSAKFFHPWYGAYEFINRQPRYCLWLGACPPNELRAMPECMKRVAAVKELRLASKSPGTQKLADRPARFHVENMPDSTYILVPRVSSERRRYVPMGFMTPDVLVSDAVQIIPGATLYHFGVLTSNVHMAWMRAVCGRLEMRYRYSKDVVYNNFPWPQVDEATREKIAATAQGILDARALYPDASLADLYDEVTMPPELRRAHQANDRAVMAAYGFPGSNFTESDCVAALLTRYQSLTPHE